jgi:hypothetical protein
MLRTRLRWAAACVTRFAAGAVAKPRPGLFRGRFSQLPNQRKRDPLRDKSSAAHFILRKIDPGLDKAGGWAVLGGPSFCVMIHVVTFLPPRMDDAAPLIFPGLPGGAN